MPIYQRTYEWTPERQLETFIDHIKAKAEARLANEPARFLHYMGALLLIPAQVLYLVAFLCSILLMANSA